MKKLLFTALAVVGLFTLATTSAMAKADTDKEITIKGDGQCGKCGLKETASCQNVIEVTKGKHKGKYYLVENDVSKSFHENICKATKSVKATGTAKTVDGKLQFTATKIEVTK